jgi:AcrR family transcriptional regulator
MHLAPMKAKSALLAANRQDVPAKPKTVKRRATVRLPAPERRELILKKAFEFFSEYGLTAQTRGLAEACGVSQRLLYSVFPSKSALISAVYDANIAGPFKAIWFVQLRDRSKPLEQRLREFYQEYYDTILTRNWLRLFLYASLAEVEIAPTYIAAIIRTLLETIVEEAVADAGLGADPGTGLGPARQRVAPRDPPAHLSRPDLGRSRTGRWHSRDCVPGGNQGGIAAAGVSPAGQPPCQSPAMRRKYHRSLADPACPKQTIARGRS